MDRFWDKVDIRGDDECWEWTGNKARGYGHFWVDGKSRQAHRVAWEFFEGPIPYGAHVLHECDNPSCVSPHHLFLGTPKVNYEDAVRKGRMNHVGEANGNSRLSESDVREIRRLHATGRISQGYLGRMFRVSQPHIFDIVRGKKWMDLLKGEERGETADERNQREMEDDADQPDPYGGI